VQVSTGAMLEGPRVTRAAWLNLVWAWLTFTLGAALTFLVRWFVRSQDSAFAMHEPFEPLNAFIHLYQFLFLGPASWRLNVWVQLCGADGRSKLEHLERSTGRVDNPRDTERLRLCHSHRNSYRYFAKATCRQTPEEAGRRSIKFWHIQVIN
jgi:hypothetical protein